MKINKITKNISEIKAYLLSHTSANKEPASMSVTHIPKSSIYKVTEVKTKITFKYNVRSEMFIVVKSSVKIVIYS